MGHVRTLLKRRTKARQDIVRCPWCGWVEVPPFARYRGLKFRECVSCLLTFSTPCGRIMAGENDK